MRSRSSAAGGGGVQKEKKKSKRGFHSTMSDLLVSSDVLKRGP